MDIAGWLRGLGLDRYEQAFRENEIDLEILFDLSEADLETLGLPLGPRKKLLRAIAALRQGASDGNAVATTSVDYAKEPGYSIQLAPERRQLTVMFCDLVGSTAMSARLDPEDFREVIGDYQTVVTTEITRFGGHIAKYMGDGVLAYFGWPQAHEDDAERALRAGLTLVEAVRDLRSPAGTAELQVRVGVATGLVVVGDLIGSGVAREQAVVGETPNLAARLQVLAAPGTVVIADATQRLTAGLFEYQDLGAVEIKGFEQPVHAWRVLGESAVESRFEARHASIGLVPLVGREEELELLIRCWTQVKSGEGRVVLISGEPGIGKSRIVAALLGRIEGEPHTRLRYFCSPYHTDSALYPIVSQLEHAAGFGREDSADARLTKLRALLVHSSASNDDVSLLAELLSLPAEGHSPLLDLTPQQKRERTLTALVKQLEGLARHSPVLVAFEDVHWADPSSLEVLTLLMDRVQHLPVLLIITFRPEFRLTWIGPPHIVSLALSRLTQSEGATLAERVADGKALPSEILEQIVSRTDGVPLFLEELTKAVLESGLLHEENDRYVLDGPLPPLAIPTSLHASLMARLDRPGAIREVAQTGAAIGREFSYELLAKVVSAPEGQLRRALAQLTEAELVFVRGTPPVASYMFKHALVQDAAYATLLRSTRQELHARIAGVIEELFPDKADTQPELLAHHCLQAGLNAKAVDYWYKAGQLAMRRSALAEAIAHVSKALDVLARLPVDVEHHRREFSLELVRAGALLQARGWASPQMGEACLRACELSRVVEGIPELELAQALHGLFTFRINRAELVAARETSEELLSLAERTQDMAVSGLAHRASAVPSMFRGEFDRALAHLALVLAYYDPVIHGAPNFSGTADARVVALSFTAWIRLFQGYFAEARARSREALGAARELSNPYSLAFSLHANCLFNQVAGDWRMVQERSALLTSLAAEQGFPHLLATGTFFQGWAAFASGETETGITRMHQGLSAKRAGGAEIKVPYYLGLLADAYRQVRRAPNALPLLAEALERVERTSERWFEAELHRLKAEVLVALDPLHDTDTEVEVLLRRALAVARAQGANLWELRASVSLARLLRAQGRRIEARGLLAPIYGWFVKGLEAPDLDSAGAVLDTLD